MKFPKLTIPYEHRAVLQNFSGGLNTSLPPQFIKVDEQSEIKNMFFNKGVLQKRPQFKKVLSLSGYTVSDIETSKGVFIYKHNIDEYGYGQFSSAFINKNGQLTTIPDITFYEENEFLNDSKGKCAYCFFPFYFNDVLYLGVGFKDSADGFMSKIYKYASGKFSRISEDKIYAPLVLVNGKGNKFSSLALGNNSIYSPQVSFEGINLLTRRVRCQFTTDGSSFSFPFILTRKYGTPVKVKLKGNFTKDSSIEEFSFVINDDGTIVSIPGLSGITCFVSNYTNITFRKSDNTACPPLAASFSNNLEIEYYIDENPNAKSFFEMSHQTTFGAARGAGGNRLFVAGNKSQKNLLRWSDLNNPLYFPENNYVCVSNGEISSLKKQGNMLLIFSNNEIHYTTYLSGSYSSEDFISGSINDITAVSALFPISQLHSEIGLFKKNACLLNNNKTIFLANDKKLYRIDNTSSITHLSHKIDSFLKENSPTHLVAGKYLNYLLLASDKGIIAYNTESDSFYIWDDKINAEYIFGDEDNPIIIATDGVYILSDLKDDEFYFTSATFDLNYPEKNKKLNKIIVNGDGGEIAIGINNKPKIFRKIIKNKPIFLNLARVKKFNFTIKNCNNFEGVVFYYTVY